MSLNIFLCNVSERIIFQNNYKILLAKMLASDLVIFMNRYYKTSPGMITLDKAGLTDTEFLTN